jgi:putative hemolysin
MMTAMKVGLALIVATTLFACSGDDERMPIGVPPVWVDYCQKLGYEVTQDGACRFPDATACEIVSFFRGECGQSHSYCSQHGGTLTTEVVDMGDFTATSAICSMPGGARCRDYDFVKNGTCQ